jgi:hypothetical protein
VIHFDDVWIAGTHQRQRAKERTANGDIKKLVESGTVVLINGNTKYFKNNECIIPVCKGKGGSNVIRTVLSRSMEIHDLIGENL